MSNKLICPFCQRKLKTWAKYKDGTSTEYCSKCLLIGDSKLFVELIRTRKALKIAWDGLEKIGSGDIIEHSVVGHEDDNKIFIANKALNESKTALEQKDNGGNK